MTAVLDELERLLREATAGRYSSETRNDETIVSADDGLGDGGFGVAAVSRVVDARLLVAMRNNFDALLAVARAAEAELDEIERALEHGTGPRTGMRVSYFGPFAQMTPALARDLNAMAARLTRALAPLRAEPDVKP